MNLIVMLVVWGAGMAIVYRWYLAVALRRAFREEVVAEPIGVVEEVRPGGVLQYARAPRKMGLGRRWPVIHAVIGGGVLLVMALPVVALMMAITTFNVLPGILLPCGASLFAVLVALVVVAVRGLRDIGGRPAAAMWRYGGRAALCWVGVMVLTWGLLEWRVQRMMHEALAKADQLGKELEIVSPDGAISAALYTQTGLMPPATVHFEDVWSLVDEHGRITAPPAFPEKNAFRIPLLRKAAGMKISGFVPAASDSSTSSSERFVASDKGMRKAGLELWQHAISEAMSGQIRSAIDDINAMHGIADHVEQGLSGSQGLHGTNIHMVAEGALEMVLPMVRSERDLDLIRVDDPDKRLQAGKRWLLGSMGITGRRDAEMAARQQFDFADLGYGQSNGWVSALNPLYRVTLADRDMRAIESTMGLLSSIPCDNPAAAAEMLPALSAWSGEMREQCLVPAYLIMPGIAKSVEAAAMADIARSAVAATRFRIQKGRLPASWNELVQAKLLPAVPIDPFDGKPMRFAVHNDFVFLYTIGRERIDHGGSPYMTKGRSVIESNLGMIVSDRPLWELDLLPKGFVPTTQGVE